MPTTRGAGGAVQANVQNLQNIKKNSCLCIKLHNENLESEREIIVGYRQWLTKPFTDAVLRAKIESGSEVELMLPPFEICSFDKLKRLMTKLKDSDWCTVSGEILGFGTWDSMIKIKMEHNTVPEKNLEAPASPIKAKQTSLGNIDNKKGRVSLQSKSKELMKNRDESKEHKDINAKSGTNVTNARKRKAASSLKELAINKRKMKLAESIEEDEESYSEDESVKDLALKSKCSSASYNQDDSLKQKVQDLEEQVQNYKQLLSLSEQVPELTKKADGALNSLQSIALLLNGMKVTCSVCQRSLALTDANSNVKPTIDLTEEDFKINVVVHNQPTSAKTKVSQDVSPGGTLQSTSSRINGQEIDHNSLSSPRSSQKSEDFMEEVQEVDEKESGSKIELDKKISTPNNKNLGEVVEQNVLVENDDISNEVLKNDKSADVLKKPIVKQEGKGGKTKYNKPVNPYLDSAYAKLVEKNDDGSYNINAKVTEKIKNETAFVKKDISGVAKLLCNSLFDPKEFIDCSISGKKGKNTDIHKPELDVNRKNAIYQFLEKNFAGATEKGKTVREVAYSIMKNKCSNSGKFGMNYKGASIKEETKTD